VTQSAKIKALLPGKFCRINNISGYGILWVLCLIRYMFCTRSVAFFTIYPVNNILAELFLGMVRGWYFFNKRSMTFKATGGDRAVKNNRVRGVFRAVSPIICCRKI